MERREAQRIATTESLFREVNERIAESAGRFEAERVEFVCECADPECTDQVEAPLADYERVRSTATRFLLVPGHEDTRVEAVVAEHPGYSVVEKVQETTAEVVRRLDRRSGDA